MGKLFITGELHSRDGAKAMAFRVVELDRDMLDQNGRFKFKVELFSQDAHEELIEEATLTLPQIGEWFNHHQDW